ncbi:PRC-barrel domain containing protein [Geodermatophilaceae bacterium NBWT11]|nr:PRC-barrel domain containing protein [Geodermatophilaceae bacterium NBWT11]
MIPAGNIRDWRGENVVDNEGHKIGSLESVYVDVVSDEPSFIGVEIGGLIGGKSLVFIPLKDSTVGPREVRVSYPRDLAKAAPNIDTDGELTAEEEPKVFAHYQLPYATGPNGERQLARR